MGEDSQYYYKYYDGSQWNPDEEAEEAWYVKNGSFSSAPSVVSWGENRKYSPNNNRLLVSVTLLVFPAMAANIPLQCSANHKVTSSFLGLDIYGVTTDAQLAHQTWYGSGWWPAYASWEILGGNLTAY